MPALPQKIAFIDVETSGTRHSDRIIEIGIVRVENGKIVEEFKSLVNPQCFVPEEIFNLTGISSAELENSPTFNFIKKDVLRLLEDCVFVAHNVRFDYSFIRNEFRREEITFKSKQLCTVKLSRALFPQFSNHNLDFLIENLKFKCKNRHRALDDAKVLYQLWSYIQKNFSETDLETALKKVLKRPSLPIKITQEILDGLPEAPGVYIFYGEKGMPLYIGKSINIRDRVLSHFSSDHSSSTEMKIAQQIESIETIVSCGELGALIKESSLIKKMQPLYNRKLRHSRVITVLKRVQNKSGYSTVEFDSADNVDVNNLGDIVGVFRNKKSAKDFLIYLAKEHELCEKLLGVDITNKRSFSANKVCFGYRLGRCKGACSNKEMVAKYNMRFAEAFTKTKILPWPFESPIIIEERDDIEGKSESFVIDKWCYLGSVSSSHSERFSEESLQELNRDISFDVDTYKILTRFITRDKNQKKIKLFKTEKLGVELSTFDEGMGLV